MTTNAERIAAAVKRGAGKGLAAAGLFLVARIKEALSVPAPKRRVVSHAGEIYYRATAPAVKGAPPRKVSGVMQRSVTLVKRGEDVIISVPAKGEKGFSYPRYHEVKTPGQAGSGLHPYARVTARKYARELATIAGGAIAAEVRT